MGYAVGSLVRARGREWVVLPESQDDFLVLRPLGGTDQEIAGIYIPLEAGDIRPATFEYPDPQNVGDFRSSRLLRDAVRLGFRSSAGPFRSFARINVEPRPYQLVPLLMALKLDPVRLLIADDVGIGKTIEAALIARELIDRGEVQRLAVLCPPQLAEQWQSELAEKFHIDAKLVLPSTVRRLEKNTGVGQSIFDIYPYVIVSTEYIKSTRRRDEFVRACPELVIVDEAHTCAFSEDNRGGRHLRHELIRRLSQDANRHLLLVTATPHSGNESAFRSLLGLLREDFLDLPEDLSGRENERYRRRVADHLVQRRRGDVREYMEHTVFPARKEAEETYTLSPEYLQLFNNILDYAREQVLDTGSSQHHQRVRWWSALALLRSLASSPAAAAATLRNRSGTVETESIEQADEIGARAVLDLNDVEFGEVLDVAPGAQTGEGQPESDRRRLHRFAARADALRGTSKDTKLAKAIKLVEHLLADGYNPILFCRFIPTAEYVAEELRKELPKNIEVAAITGSLPPAEREARVASMAESKQRVLVATDCLSEGINLQDVFTAVVHYDLSWNPTRHEQREGRVDRFGQAAPVVRAVTYYGTDNQIDGIVLDVLLRKHKAIRTSLGISVPLPANTSQVVEALMQGLLLRGSKVSPRQYTMSFMNDVTMEDLEIEWDNVSQREKRSHSMFAQHRLNPSVVAREWEAVRAVIGTNADVEQLVKDVVEGHGGFIAKHNGITTITLTDGNPLIELCGGEKELKVCYQMPVPEGVTYLTRTHPIVASLAAHTMDSALDPLLDGVAKRCGAIRTQQVATRTVLLLMRYRYHIDELNKDKVPLLAETCEVLAFQGRGDSLAWLPAGEAERLLQAFPDRNMARQQQMQRVAQIINELPSMKDSLNGKAEAMGADVKDAHERVRQAARQRGAYDVRTQLPPDVLGVYVLLPLVH